MESENTDTLAEIIAAADGLLVPSESDFPFEPFRWPDPGPFTPEALIAHLGLPPGTPVEIRELDRFFAPLTVVREWHDDSQRATTARFALLRDLLHDQLADVVVYRVGQIRIAVVIAGRASTGAIVGLRTTLIET